MVIVLCFVLVVVVQTVVGQNPCVPNPCGENTRCLTQQGASARAVISCQCLPGFIQNPEGPFEGCLPLNPAAQNPQSSSESSRAEVTSTSTTTVASSTSTRTSATERPYIIPTSRTVIGFDSSGAEVKFHEADSDHISGGVENLNPIELNQNAPALPLPPHIKNLDKSGIFNEECLVSEDCASSEFCDVSIRKCSSACASDSCGISASCKGVLHRPVCFCPKGFEGDPQRRCDKTKSRAGTRFRRG